MKTVIVDRNIAHVDKDTGETICESEGVITIKDSRLTDKEEKRLKYLKEHEMNFKKGEPFVKLFPGILPYLTEHTTPSEFVFIINLSRFVCYEDCILQAVHRGNGRILSMKDMAELLNMNYNVVRRLVSSLKKKGIIGKHEVGSIHPDAENLLNIAYTVNPHIFFRGRHVNKSILAFYQDTGWAELLEDIE